VSLLFARFFHDHCPKIDENIEKSVEWALEMNRQGMAEVGLNGQRGKIM
jgi:hypothetical protein